MIPTKPQLALLTCAALVLAVTLPSNAQRHWRAPMRFTQDFHQRILRLERRVDQLERRLGIVQRQEPTPVTPKSVPEAEANLATAQQWKQHKERLARKGYITESELADAQLALMIAQRDLAQTKGETEAARRMSLEIDVFEAQSTLADARSGLKYTQQLLRRGLLPYRGGAEVENWEIAVERAEQDLRNAKAHLAAETGTEQAASGDAPTPPPTTDPE